MSPFPQLLVPAYLILFWTFSLAFMASAVISYFSFKQGALEFLREHPGTWGAYAALQILLSVGAFGIATASWPDFVVPTRSELNPPVLLT